MGDVPFLVEVINCYLAETPIHLRGLRTAIGQKDRAALRYAAHSLKSSSAMVGAIALASLCAQLEALSQPTSTALVDLPILLAPLEAEYERVQTALARAAQTAEHESYL